jgi:hypothetical protein
MLEDPEELDPLRPRLPPDTSGYPPGTESVPNVWPLTGTDFAGQSAARVLSLFRLPPEAVAAFARFLWPDLVLYQNFVFLEEGFTRSRLELFEQTEAATRYGMYGVAASMNHLHVTDLIPGLHRVLSKEKVAAIEVIIGNCWAARFRDAFPDRVFRFEIGEVFRVWEGPTPSFPPPPEPPNTAT